MPGNVLNDGEPDTVSVLKVCICKSMGETYNKKQL